MPTQTGAMTTHPFGTGQFDPFKAFTYDFIDFTFDGGPDRSLHPGVDFGPFLFCFNSSPSVLVGDVTIDPVTFLFTCPAHGLVNGNQVRFDSDGQLPIGLNKSVYYFVVNAATNTFQVSTASGGAPVPITDVGIGDHNVTKRGLPLDLTGWTVWSWVGDANQNKLLDLGPTILVPTTLGTVQIKVPRATSTAANLVNGTYSWDMTAQDNSGNRMGALAKGQFVVQFLNTRPP